jgi:phage terminase large subunit-like protein
VTDISELSGFEKLALLDADARELYLEEEARKHGKTPDQLKGMLARNWRFIGRPKQFAPAGNWYAWWVRAGRGFGKTLTFAQWAKEKAVQSRVRIALVAPTFGDVRDTMVEGETGLLSVLPNMALLGQSRSHAWNRSIGELTLANGTKFRAFSSEEPNRIRGPQHHYAWCEEISSFADAGKGDKEDTTWSNVKLSTRLGEFPQIGISSTPKTNALTKELVAMAKAGRLVMTQGSSWENRTNLSDAWWEQVVVPYLGTRLGRQEIEAEILEDVEGALWTRHRIERMRIRVPNMHSIAEYRAAGLPSLQRIVVAVDPNASSGEASNSAGVVVVGRGTGTGQARRGYVLEDRTVERGGPRAWATAAVEAYYDWHADRIVPEKNNGGEMVRITIETVDATVPIDPVWASRGKRTRAEPISSLYEGEPDSENPPKVHHVGVFPELEDEMSTWTPEQESPDRMDALVWGLSSLLLGQGSGQYRSSTPKGRINTSAAEARRLAG